MNKSAQNKQLKVIHEERVCTESSGKKSDNFYRAIFENIKVPIIITDNNLKVITINHMFEIMSGYSLEELVGKNAWSLIASAESLRKTKRNHRLRKLNPNLAPVYYEIETSDKHGNVKHLNLHASFIPDTEEIVVTLVDITEQRRAESMFKASENYYETIFENTGAATLLIEEDETISMVNSECEKTLGYKIILVIKNC